jgi:TATA-box binding protein (TBP) (component of TFIID and TFIIIB)
MFSNKVQEKYRNFLSLRINALNSIRRIDRELRKCKPPKEVDISTMNIMCSLSLKRINLSKIKDLLSDPQTKNMADESFNTNVTLQIDREFNNSIIVKYEFETVTMAIKLFVNGNLQISGCRCVEDALLNSQLMCRFLERMSKVEPGTYTVVDFDIHMVNNNFVLGVPTFINLAKLHDHINQNYRLFQRYDLSNHAGLIITKMSCVSNASSITIMVFSNAQCIITGWKMWEELVDAYNTILMIVDEAYDKIVGSTASAALRNI